MSAPLTDPQKRALVALAKQTRMQIGNGVRAEDAWVAAPNVAHLRATTDALIEAGYAQHRVESGTGQRGGAYSKTFQWSVRLLRITAAGALRALDLVSKGFR